MAASESPRLLVQRVFSVSSVLKLLNAENTAATQRGTAGPSRQGGIMDETPMPHRGSVPLITKV
jgi:hypothetical protein